MYHGAQTEDSILEKYSTFHLELLNTPTLLFVLMMEISFMSSFQALTPDGAGLVASYVEKAKSGTSRAEFYKNRVLTIEVSGLMLLS